jgi:hypothetical protein
MSSKGKSPAIYIVSYLLALSITSWAQPLDVPQLRGAIQAPSQVGFSRVCVSGTTAYVVGSYDLCVIDVSNPGSPQLIRKLKLPLPAYGELFVGNSRMLVQEGWQFTVYDISDPRVPRGGSLMNIFQPPLGSAGIGGIYLTSDTAVVSLAWPFPLAFETFDISDPFVSVSLGVTWSEVVGSGSSLIMKSSGTLSYCYHQGETGLLTVVNCANPRAIQILSTISVSFADAMSVSDRKVFLFGPKNQVINVSDPTKPAILDQYQLPSWPREFKPTFLNNRAYVLDGGFQSYDLSDPLNPRRTGGVSCFAADVAFAGNLAFVASGSELLIFQIDGTPQPPALNVKRTATGAWIIRWPGHAVDYELYSSSDTGLTWQPVVATPAIDNGFLSVPINVSAHLSAQLFQLRAKAMP